MVCKKKMGSDSIPRDPIPPCEILAVAVKPESRVRLRDALAALGRKVGLTNGDFQHLTATLPIR